MCPSGANQAIHTVLKKQMNAKIGGPPSDYAVIIDETFFTKKKVAKGGFQGRITEGHTVILMAGVEINLHTRAETGRKFLVIIPNRAKTTFQA
eukprot:8454417-Karenia_brevis.AAC.1